MTWLCMGTPSQLLLGCKRQCRTGKRQVVLSCWLPACCRCRLVRFQCSVNLSCNPVMQQLKGRLIEAEPGSTHACNAEALHLQLCHPKHHSIMQRAAFCKNRQFISGCRWPGFVVVVLLFFLCYSRGDPLCSGCISC